MLIIDLHLHSRFAYATSKELTLPNLYKWSKLKGIHVLGTGDFTHPTWMSEIEEQLEPAEEGLFVLKEKYREKIDAQLPQIVRKNIHRFLLTVEVSCIYHRHGKLRKVHHVIVVSSLDAAKKLNRTLDESGAHLHADGRPTLTTDFEKLIRLVFEIDEKAMFIPAHIWTPWFGLFGSKSGFDSLEEAFGESSNLITAVETGLSSDPDMNRKLTQLDGVTVLSNSDAHSLQKLAREATLLECELSYSDIREAIKSNDQRMVGTIEFYPQEGKYHWDGHRNCNFSCAPTQTQTLKSICPVCGKQLTVGVDNRVESLANRQHPKQPKKVDYIIPLAELIASVKGIKSIKSKTVEKTYFSLLEKAGDEFTILRTLETRDVARLGFAEIAAAIETMRAGKVEIIPGFDGVFGTIKIPTQISEQKFEQGSLF